MTLARFATTQDDQNASALPLLENQEEDAWKADFAAETPLPPVLWGWTQNALLLIFNTWMVKEYASESKDLKIGDSPVWATYVLIQLLAMAYSWVTVNYVFPRYPTVFGIPFFLLGFTPAFLIVAIPYVCTDLGWEIAKNAPISLLTFWAVVRLQFESTVQLHANYGVKGISYWLLWPVQKAPEPYTLTYPVIGEWTRTNGGNVDAASALCVGLPTALICALVNDDSSSGIIALAWVAQVWMFVYLCFLGPVPHFLGGMPGPNNVFDFKGTPKAHTSMFGLQRGVLGTCCYWIASYAVVHFIVFVMKFLQ